MKTPMLVVDSDAWSRYPAVFFYDDNVNDFICPEWVDEEYDRVMEGAANTGEFEEVTKEDIATDMENRFFSENSEVSEFWPELHILRAGQNFYRYNEDGTCHFIRSVNDDATTGIAPATKSVAEKGGHNV